MFQNVRSEEPAESVASVPLPDLPGELLSLAAAAKRRSGTKLERRMTELERARISERIKEARTQAGLTQEELADLLHVRSRTIANYEAGRVPWRLLGQIGEFTGKTQQWLLHGAEPGEEPAGGGAAEKMMQEALDNQREIRATLKQLADDVADLAEDVQAALEDLGSRAAKPGSASKPRKRRAG